MAGNNSNNPTVKKTQNNTNPTVKKSQNNTANPTVKKSQNNTANPTVKKSQNNTANPTVKRSQNNTANPTVKKSQNNTANPTAKKSQNNSSNTTKTQFNPVQAQMLGAGARKANSSSNTTSNKKKMNISPAVQEKYNQFLEVYRESAATWHEVWNDGPLYRESIFHGWTVLKKKYSDNHTDHSERIGTESQGIYFAKNQNEEESIIKILDYVDDSIRAKKADVDSLHERYHARANGIMKYYEVGEEVFDGKEVSYEIMEYCGDISIEDFIYSNPVGKSFSLKDVYDFVKQMNEMLTLFNKMNYIHSDLKPSNIMIDTKGGNRRYVIIDFGNALGFTQTKKGISKGYTPGFAAPELYGESQQPITKADYYSLGRIMFVMATGGYQAEWVLDESKYYSLSDYDKNIGTQFDGKFISIYDGLTNPNIESRYFGDQLAHKLEGSGIVFIDATYMLYDDQLYKMMARNWDEALEFLFRNKSLNRVLSDKKNMDYAQWEYAEKIQAAQKRNNGNDSESVALAKLLIDVNVEHEGFLAYQRIVCNSIEEFVEELLNKLRTPGQNISDEAEIVDKGILSYYLEKMNLHFDFIDQLQGKFDKMRGLNERRKALFQVCYTLSKNIDFVFEQQVFSVKENLFEYMKKKLNKNYEEYIRASKALKNSEEFEIWVKKA